MKELSLDGTWTLRPLRSLQPGLLKGKTIPAKVPGDVLTQLLQAKRVPDPFYRENEQDLQWVGEIDWEYTRTFQLTSRMLGEDQVLLQCDGLDSICDIYINGSKVAATNNMHRQYEWDIKPLLKAGNNKIQVTCMSPNEYSRKEYGTQTFRARVTEGHPTAYPGVIRKEACNFGWDWGPVLVTAGIWRSIRLLACSKGRITETRIQQNHSDGVVELDIRCAFAVQQPEGIRAAITVSLDGETAAHSEKPIRSAKCRQRLTIHKPQLWWPRGMGAQPLYLLTVRLVDANGKVQDSCTKRIGLRTLRLDRHEDQWGESFQFLANGVPFFAKGANWIPVDALPGRRTPQMYRRLLQDAADVNMNMIRVWGGGIYEEDIFYDICDELGLCVWQDFMFACIGYPSWDKAFMQNVEAEARDNVRRIGHHACIALWCGNNELEQQAVGKDRGKLRIGWSDYKKLFDALLARVVRDLAPDTDYWPSSPHSPHGDRSDFNNPDCGDAHLWDVWHGKKPFEWYRTCGHRFNSEFGFQSFPEPKTVNGYTVKSDRNITTPVMEHHQRSGIGNTTIMQYLLDGFRLPTSFDMTLWTSQILQGMAIKYACEHWRRSMPRGMGTLYWQLNDVWPVASWASIDYHGRWKALHYMARNFFAPVLLSGLEDKEKGAVDLHLTSDLLVSKSCTVRWDVTDASGKSLMAGSKAVRTPINANRKIATLKLAPVLKRRTERDVMVWLELELPGQPVQRNLVLFARPKHMALSEKPAIRTKVADNGDGSFSVTLQARRAALWVWLESEKVDIRCSDNFFHLCPGSPTVITVRPSRDMTLAAFRASLHAHSLVDTYKA